MYHNFDYRLRMQSSSSLSSCHLYTLHIYVITYTSRARIKYFYTYLKWSNIQWALQNWTVISNPYSNIYFWHIFYVDMMVLQCATYFTAMARIELYLLKPEEILHNSVNVTYHWLFIILSDNIRNDRSDRMTSLRTDTIQFMMFVTKTALFP